MSTISVILGTILNRIKFYNLYYNLHSCTDGVIFWPNVEIHNLLLGG